MVFYLYFKYNRNMDYSDVIKKIKPSIAFINTEKGTGSGFIFLEKNILVTCNHVVKGCRKIFVRFQGTENLDAEAIIHDEEHDLALLKFNDNTREPLVLAEDQTIIEGMPIIFSGYPAGLKNITTHQGIISSITKDPIGIIHYLIDGTVNRGNSGCPLMNSNGMVIGVVNALQIVESELLSPVMRMESGAISLYKTDVVDLFKAIINNLQLGIGYAVPASYIPNHKIIETNKDNIKKDGGN